MNLFQRLLRRKHDTAEQGLDADMRKRIRELATKELIAELQYLLEEGYERDAVISIGGPVGRQPATIAWFCAIIGRVVTDFIQTHPVWRGDTRKTAEKCREEIILWGVKHGSDRKEIETRIGEIDEGYTLFRAIFILGNKEVLPQLTAWEAKVGGEDLMLYMMEDSLVITFLRNPNCVYNRYPSTWFADRAGESPGVE